MYVFSDCCLGFYIVIWFQSELVLTALKCTSHVLGLEDCASNDL